MGSATEIQRATAAAELLTAARLAGERLESLGEHAPLSVSDAHLIADIHAEQMSRATVGWKVSATSTYAMQVLNSPGPFACRVFDGAVHQTGATQLPGAVSPGVESEFAFFIGVDLPARRERYSVADVRSATEAVAPAIELVDARFNDMLAVGYLSLIADSGANGGVILGEKVPVEGLTELKDVAVRCQIDDEIVSTGSGSDILGDPWLALEWLANHLAARGLGLRAGQFVMSGTCTAIFPLNVGSSVRATYDGLGEVTAAHHGSRSGD